MWEGVGFFVIDAGMFLVLVFLGFLGWDWMVFWDQFFVGFFVSFLMWFGVDLGCLDPVVLLMSGYALVRVGWCVDFFPDFCFGFWILCGSFFV